MKNNQSESLPSGVAPTQAAPRSLSSLEERVAYLEHLLSLDSKAPTPSFDVEAFLSSPEGLAEFRRACRRLFTFNDMKPLEALAKKTGGRMPKDVNGDS